VASPTLLPDRQTFINTVTDAANNESPQSVANAAYDELRSVLLAVVVSMRKEVEQIERLLEQ
jgi:hypothetical protein